jgi:hypothetical protein
MSKLVDVSGNSCGITLTPAPEDVMAHESRTIAPWLLRGGASW